MKKIIVTLMVLASLGTSCAMQQVSQFVGDVHPDWETMDNKITAEVTQELLNNPQFVEAVVQLEKEYNPHVYQDAKRYAYDIINWVTKKQMSARSKIIESIKEQAKKRAGIMLSDEDIQKEATDLIAIVEELGENYPEFVDTQINTWVDEYIAKQELNDWFGELGVKKQSSKKIHISQDLVIDSIIQTAHKTYGLKLTPEYVKANGKELIQTIVELVEDNPEIKGSMVESFIVPWVEQQLPYAFQKQAPYYQKQAITIPVLSTTSILQSLKKELTQKGHINLKENIGQKALELGTNKFAKQQTVMLNKIQEQGGMTQQEFDNLYEKFITALIDTQKEIEQDAARIKKTGSFLKPSALKPPLPERKRPALPPRTQQLQQTGKLNPNLLKFFEKQQ